MPILKFFSVFTTNSFWLLTLLFVEFGPSLWLLVFIKCLASLVYLFIIVLDNFSLPLANVGADCTGQLLATGVCVCLCIGYVSIWDVWVACLLALPWYLGQNFQCRLYPRSKSRSLIFFSFPPLTALMGIRVTSSFTLLIFLVSIFTWEFLSANCLIC